LEYGWFFSFIGPYVEKSNKVFVEWLEKAANQNNPQAMDWLGNSGRYGDDDDKEKSVSLWRSAAELGWTIAMSSFARMLAKGNGCAKDWRQAAIWSAKGHNWILFCDLVCKTFQRTETFLDCEFNQLCYSLGWGVYWYVYGSEQWGAFTYVEDEFGRRCLDYYCSCVELQQKSIVTFLLFWNQTVGIKDVGVVIGKMVWEEREDNLVKSIKNDENF
jgi:hypothetical protein